ncbi:DSPc domain containing protein [Trichuris trichiura]|uniref:protein-tyrosine-phosphatase n=1 Tax=Trichuris trichiura TaxID=36087 RepID=A0A077YZU0_TRITR|nr:DSPc domain containing protein [Trichuris trichiura]
MSVPTRFCRGVTSTEDGDVDKDDAESTSWAPLASLSQPCLPVSNLGPTKILPFLYLGSQQDAMDEDLLKVHRIDYVLNMSVASPKPDFLQEEHFLRIPVNDSYSEKLLPYFDQAFQLIFAILVDKVRNTNANVLVHCLAGISRSPTLVIACVMRYLRMSSEEAYRYVKDKRPSISPNFNFLGQLLEFEKNLKSISLADDNDDSHFAGLPPFSTPVDQSKQCRSGLRTKFGTLRTGWTSKKAIESNGGPEDVRMPAFPSFNVSRFPSLRLMKFSSGGNSSRVSAKGSGTFGLGSVARKWSVERHLRRQQPTKEMPRADAKSDWMHSGRQSGTVVLSSLGPSKSFLGLGSLCARKKLPEELPSPSTELSKLSFNTSTDLFDCKDSEFVSASSSFDSSHSCSSSYVSLSSVCNPTFVTAEETFEKKFAGKASIIGSRHFEHTFMDAEELLTGPCPKSTASDGVTGISVKNPMFQCGFDRLSKLTEKVERPQQLRGTVAGKGPPEKTRFVPTVVICPWMKNVQGNSKSLYSPARDKVGVNCRNSSSAAETWIFSTFSHKVRQIMHKRASWPRTLSCVPEFVSKSAAGLSSDSQMVQPRGLPSVSKSDHMLICRTRDDRHLTLSGNVEGEPSGYKDCCSCLEPEADSCGSSSSLEIAVS